MKTKEELNRLKDAVANVHKKLDKGDIDEGKKFADDLDRALTELNEEDLREVFAGSALSLGNYSSSKYEYVHKNCGGTIKNGGNPFASCYCDRCGETHYFYLSFDLIKVEIE